VSEAQSLSFDDLLEVARSRDEILGLYVFGSRGRDGTRLDAVEAIPPALRTIFARVRPEAQRELFDRIEPLARGAGCCDVIDGWEPDVDRLRGKGEYRA
jgi:hypothetical protein